LHFLSFKLVLIFSVLFLVFIIPIATTVLALLGEIIEHGIVIVLVRVDVLRLLLLLLLGDHGQPEYGSHLLRRLFLFFFFLLEVFLLSVFVWTVMRGYLEFCFRRVEGEVL
jgi:hypothetical protein